MWLLLHALYATGVTAELSDPPAIGLAQSHVIGRLHE